MTLTKRSRERMMKLLEEKAIVPATEPDGCVEISTPVFDEHNENAMKVGMKIKIDGTWYGWNETKKK